MGYTVEVIRDACVSAGSCAVIADDTFELDDEGLAVVKKQNGDSDEEILEAAKSCPTNAVVVKDENGKQIWPEQ
ncbi:MAG: ferredoxin [Candidatus Kerfeldbacteria bacterium]